MSTLDFRLQCLEMCDLRVVGWEGGPREVEMAFNSSLMMLGQWTVENNIMYTEKRDCLGMGDSESCVAAINIVCGTWCMQDAVNAVLGECKTQFMQYLVNALLSVSNTRWMQNLVYAALRDGVHDFSSTHCMQYVRYI